MAAFPLSFVGLLLQIVWCLKCVPKPISCPPPCPCPQMCPCPPVCPCPQAFPCEPVFPSACCSPAIPMGGMVMSAYAPLPCA